MKGLLKLAITLMCVLTVAGCFLLPVNAETEDLNAQLDFTDTYFYDRINERQQWCYNYLKEYYDNFSGDPGLYSYDWTNMLPEGSTEEEYIQLGRDFSVGEMALKADHPLYKMKGFFSGYGCDTTGETTGVFGKISFNVWISYTDLLTEDTEAQVASKIEQIVASVGEGDRYTKLRKLTHYILSNSFYDPYFDIINGKGHYDYALATRGHFYNQSIYGFFLKNIAVCDGFSQSVKVLCDALDIPCIIIGNHGHAWNMVQMEDGSWYYLDMTAFSKVRWDDEGFLGFGFDLDLYFQEIFLNNDNEHSFGYDDPYMISLDNVRYVTEFPELASGRYEYKGDTTDFSYTLAPSTYASGEPIFSYTVNIDGKTCTIINFEGKQEGNLVIPENLDGYTVTAIGDYAFYYCTDFTGKLIIPDTVKTIGYSAFAGCYNLTEINLPDGLRTIEKGAFIGCVGLTEIIFPDLLDTISEYAFYDCDSLKTVCFGSHIQIIEDKAFGEIRGDFIFKAPKGSVAEKYALENDISFEENGTLCSFVDIDGDWEFDDNCHFHTCRHGGRFDIRGHINNQGYFNCGDRCEVCNAQKCNKYGFMENAEIVIGAHPATCVSPEYTGDVVCVCQNTLFRSGEFIGEETGVHISNSEMWESDLVTHYHTCKDCEMVFDIDIHVGGTATETEYAKCEVCGAEYGELIHTYHKGQGWEYNVGVHYQICKDCNQWFDVAEHSGGTATETEYAKCEVCGAEYGELLHVRHEGQGWEYNSDAHWQWCVCGEIMDSGLHSGGTATSTERAKCEVCGAEYGELLKIESEAESTGKTPESSGKPEASSSVPEESDSSVSAGDAPDKTWLIAVIAAVGVVIIVGAILAIKLSRKKK